jgi:hypothetical protein
MRLNRTGKLFFIPWFWSFDGVALLLIALRLKRKKQGLSKR